LSLKLKPLLATSHLSPGLSAAVDKNGAHSIKSAPGTCGKLMHQETNPRIFLNCGLAKKMKGGDEGLIKEELLFRGVLIEFSLQGSSVNAKFMGCGCDVVVAVG
jgi:hypothetical protein